MADRLKKKKFDIIGLNSGTSADGLDAALVRFVPGKKPCLLFATTYRYSSVLRKKILSLAEPGFTNGEEWIKLDVELGEIFGKYARRFISELESRNLRAGYIASHGQTIRHLPLAKGKSCSYQIGDSAYIAKYAGLPVISDFRKSDLAAGGQGAPLSPVIHRLLFQSTSQYRAVLNIGGIANITILPPKTSGKRPISADCGPGNMAVDKGMEILFNKRYDRNGRAAMKGIPDYTILRKILRTRFFRASPPKSTGRELFGSEFTKKIINSCKGRSGYDIIATVSELTVMAVADFIRRFAPGTEKLFICGGGAQNRFFRQRLNYYLNHVDILSTADPGYDPDYIESMLWAYLGYCHLNGKRIDTRNYTGSAQSYIPGKICLP